MQLHARCYLAKLGGDQRLHLWSMLAERRDRAPRFVDFMLSELSAEQSRRGTDREPLPLDLGPLFGWEAGDLMDAVDLTWTFSESLQDIDVSGLCSSMMPTLLAIVRKRLTLFGGDHDQHDPCDDVDGWGSC